jgi:hypothetical protein
MAIMVTIIVRILVPPPAPGKLITELPLATHKVKKRDF